jgi:hypothetical protein
VTAAYDPESPDRSPWKLCFCKNNKRLIIKGAGRRGVLHFQDLRKLLLG